MSTAAAALSTSMPTTPSAPTAPAIAPSLIELEDMLYDILASGADPNLGTDTLEAVQLFVHEHARNKKTQAEFLAFFAAQELSTQPERTALMALPPLEARGRAVETPPLATLPRPPDPPLAAHEPVAANRARGWLWAALFAAVSGMAGVAYGVLLEARDQLAAVRSESALNAAELVRARGETETLRADLRGQARLLRQLEHRSDVLLQSFASPLDPNTK